MKIKLNNNSRVMIKAVFGLLLFYFVLMILWNFTNTTHKPTNLLWDWKKEGYKENPLHDRK